MSFSIKEGLTFDDVLLIPKHSEIPSRSHIDVSVGLGKFHFSNPIIPANMQTITGSEMAQSIISNGGLAILHRFMPMAEQLEIAKSFDYINSRNDVGHMAASVGVKELDQQSVTQFAEVGVRIICIDIAHGDSEQCLNMIRWIKEKHPKMFVIAGNVATGNAAERLWLAGADAVKVGVGPGSLCTTRVETGNGVPQLTALIDVAEVKDSLTNLQQGQYGPSINYPIYTIADGGIKSAGDIVKALCLSDMVMLGNMFAGCVETPGQVMSIDGRTFKNYVGSSTHKTSHVEGVAAVVPTKGRYKDILTKLLEGLKSGCSYQGAGTIKELQKHPEFIRITNAGLKESHPHDVIIT